MSVDTRLDGVLDREAFMALAAESVHLSPEDYLKIVDQAELVLRDLYVHLQQKQALYAVNPLDRLKVLRNKIIRLRDTYENLDFHLDMIRIFNSLHDPHTCYLLPEPFRNFGATLPFMIEEYFDPPTTQDQIPGKPLKGQNHYIITKIVRAIDKFPEPFKTGVEVTHYNGILIERMVQILEDRQPGATQAARHERALEALSFRALQCDVLPDEEWVELGLKQLNKDGSFFHKFQWYFIRLTNQKSTDEPSLPSRQNSPATQSANRPSPIRSVDVRADMIQLIRAKLFAGTTPDSQPAARTHPQINANPPQVLLQSVPLPPINDFDHTQIFSASSLTYQALGGMPSVTSKSYEFGYLRLWTFDVGNVNKFIDTLAYYLESPKFRGTGLIIDIRHNPGGDHEAAEQMLGLFADHIEPVQMQSITTPLVRELCSTEMPLKEFEADYGWAWKKWHNALQLIEEALPPFSLGFSITNVKKLNRRYFYPVVLVADAHCYSAADIFAAGFQDNEIGNILFVGSNTGAGGADVMEHKDLVDRFKDNQSRSFKSLSPLPCGTGLSVAVRRVLRTGSNGGVPLEDIGLKAKDGDDHYDMKREDILGHNESLLAKACQMLVTKVKSKSVWPDFYVLDRVSLKISEDKRVKFSLVTSGLESIHVSLFLEDNEVEQPLIDTPIPEELDGQAIIDFPFDETSALIKIVGRVRGGESVITTGLFI